jgi:hypothetical protein
MQVCGYTVECYVNVVSANVEILIVERLVDVAHKLGTDDELLIDESVFLGP